MAGFRKCGIHPLDPQPVLNRLPRTVDEISAETERANSSVSEEFLNHPRQLRHGEEGSARRAKRKLVDVIPGRSIGATEDEEEASAAAKSIPVEDEGEDPAAAENITLETDSESERDVSESDTEADERNIFETLNS